MVIISQNIRISLSKFILSIITQNGNTDMLNSYFTKLF